MWRFVIGLLPAGVADGDGVGAAVGGGGRRGMCGGRRQRARCGASPRGSMPTERSADAALRVERSLIRPVTGLPESRARIAQPRPPSVPVTRVETPSFQTTPRACGSRRSSRRLPHGPPRAGRDHRDRCCSRPCRVRAEDRAANGSCDGLAVGATHPGSSHRNPDTTGANGVRAASDERHQRDRLLGARHPSLCVVPACPLEIMHTENGGGSFKPIPAAGPSDLAAQTSTPGPSQVGDLRFADASDGWVFGDNPPWATHDGGLPPGQESTLGRHPADCVATGTRSQWVRLCRLRDLHRSGPTASGCVFRVPKRSRAGSPTTGHVLSPPGHPTGRPVIGVHGDTLWVMYFERSPGLEWISRDDGNLWVRGSMPCEPDLGGTLRPGEATR